MASASSLEVQEWLRLAFGASGRLEIRLIPPLARLGPRPSSCLSSYSSSVPASEVQAACQYLGLSARGMEPSGLLALFPAFTTWRIAAKGLRGEVFLIDTWSGLASPACSQALPGEFGSHGPGADLAEAYLGWERGQSYRFGAEFSESLASLYTLVVFAGLEARLLGVFADSTLDGLRCSPLPMPLDLGQETDLSTKFFVLCPQGEVSPLQSLPRASAVSWHRALG